MFKLPSLRLLVDSATETFFRFPGTIFSAVFATVLGIYMIEHDIKNHADEFRMILSLMLGVPLFLSIQLFIESRNIEKREFRSLLYGAGVVGLLGVYYWLVVDSTDSVYLRFIQLSLASV